MKRVWTASVVSAGLLACGPAMRTPPEIVFGAVIDRTGNNSEPSWADAMKLAEKHANAGLEKFGALKGVGFNIILKDSANEPSVAVTRAEGLVKNQNVKALILDTSQVNAAVHRLYYDGDASNDLNVPLQCGSCTSGSINNAAATDPDAFTQLAYRNADKWNFRSIMSTKLISQVLVRLLTQNGGSGDVNGDGKFKIAYLASDEVFGRGAVRDLKAYATQLHTTSPVIVEEIYHPRDADANSYNWTDAAKLITDNQTNGATDGEPDAVVLANFAQQQAAFVKAYKLGNYKARVLHYHTFRISAALQSLGSLGNGSEGVSHVSLDNGASGEVFAQQFERTYGTPVVYRDSVYYDTAMTFMLASAIAAFKLDDPMQVSGKDIRDAMAKTSVKDGEIIRTGADEFAKALGLIAQGKPINYEGASGPMDYDALGNIYNRLAQYRAENNQFVDVAKFDCVKSATCDKMD